MPQRLEPRTEVAANDVTFRQELVDRAVDGGTRDGKRAAARTEDRHTYDPAMRVNEGAPFGSRVQAQVKTNEPVDSAAADTSPRPAGKGDDAQRGQRRTFTTADGCNHVPGANRGICDRRCRQSIGLKPKHGDVSGGIPACKRGLDFSPSGKRQPDVFVTLQRFFGGDDHAGAPMDATRGPSAATMNGDDAACSAFDERRDLI